MASKCDPQLCIILRYLCFHLDWEQFEQEANANDEFFGRVVRESKRENTEERSEQVYLVLKKLLFPDFIKKSSIRSSLFELDENLVELIKLVHSVEKVEQASFLESYEKVKSAFRICGAVCLFCNKAIEKTFDNAYFAQVCMRDFQPKEECKLSKNARLIVDKANSEVLPKIKPEVKYKIGYKTLVKFGGQILDAKKNNEQLFAQLYKRREECRNVNEPTLYVLRRYNSFTPILNSETKYGGGFFLWTGKKGIIIDPGFDFIKSFIKAGFCLSLIDAIVITHAHPDHLADLSSILTLLYEYNDSLEHINFGEDGLTFRFDKNNSRKKQKIDLYLNISSYCYLNGILNVFDSQSNYSVHILEKETMRKIDKNLLLIAMPTVHKDCISKDLGIGICIKDEDRNKSFLYTSDTSVTSQLLDDYKRIADEYGITHAVLLANIGGVAWNELKATFFAEKMENDDIQVLPKNYRYGNHLGLIGLCSLARVLQPEVIMVSELGSEFHEFRVDFIEEFRKEIGIPCLLADLGLSVRIFEQKCAAYSNSGIRFLPFEIVRELELYKNGNILYTDGKEETRAMIQSSQDFKEENAWIKNVLVV
jgi:hypothetical protein